MSNSNLSNFYSSPKVIFNAYTFFYHFSLGHTFFIIYFLFATEMKIYHIYTHITAHAVLVNMRFPVKLSEHFITFTNFLHSQRLMCCFFYFVSRYRPYVIQLILCQLSWPEQMVLPNHRQQKKKKLEKKNIGSSSLYTASIHVWRWSLYLNYSSRVTASHCERLSVDLLNMKTTCKSNDEHPVWWRKSSNEKRKKTLKQSFGE